MLSYIIYGFVRLLSFLPLRILYFISDLIYLFVYYIFRYRRGIVNQNLQLSFPEKSKNELKLIGKEFYLHFCDIFIETIKFWTISESEIKQRCKFIQSDFMSQYEKEGKSVIAILGHYGNWEWMTSFSAWNDYLFMPIYKPLHNKVFDKMFIQIRERFGAKTLPKQDTLRRMLSCRNQNRFTITAFIGDQTPNKRNIHYWTTFLNQDTPILQGTERIAKKMDQAVVYVCMRKIKRGYYEVEFIPLFDHPKQTAEFEITEKHTRILEEIIKSDPAYWLWSHNRWKHKKEI
ncbi:lipid A biosynthesis acyltransferase [Ancylomarina longa]|uniref:Lipid A biosynthesis acyltransferase n=1 Tax=Ancylomarina longa TaxID=2487017 RepID=A0A434AGS3_9BACT|nr:lipid A biosynthesis acyltransferase [Ancylomarina longa]